MSWVNKLENKIFTIVEARTKSAIGSKYTDLNFTMDGEPDDTKNHFPTVYIHYMPSYERGETFDADDVNAIMSTIQIEVTASKSQGQNVAREVAWEVITQFKKLKYKMNLAPEIIATGNDTSKVVARVKRMIGGGDTIE